MLCCGIVRVRTNGLHVEGVAKINSRMEVVTPNHIHMDYAQRTHDSLQLRQRPRVLLEPGAGKTERSTSEKIARKTEKKKGHIEV